VIAEIIRIGTRNIRRNPRRTLTTALSVAMGACVAMVLIGTRQSTYDRLIASAAMSGYGIVNVSQPGYLADPTPSSRIHFDDKTLKSLKQIRGIQEVSPRVSAAAVVYTAKNSTGARLLGVDPRFETATNNLMISAISSGVKIQQGVSDDCLVGSALANQLGLKIGDKMVFTTTDAQGQIVSNIVHVGGIFHTGSPELDGHVAILPITLLQKTLGYEPSEASFLALYSAPETVSKDLLTAVKKKISGSVVAKAHVAFWRESFPEVAQTIDIDATLNTMLLIFAAVIISTGILNAMMLNIIERRREFGIMLATGMSPGNIIFMVAWEGFILGLIGLVIGAIAATPIYYYLHNVGLDLSAFIGEQRDKTVVAMDQVVGCRLSVKQAISVASGLMIMSLVAGLYPACKAAFTVPIKAIRSQ